MKLIIFVCLLFLVKISVQCCWAYEIPPPKFKIYRKGFEVSIPHEEGITLFTFHGNLNKEMNDREVGDWSCNVKKHKNGHWIFRNSTAELKLGDTIYYWTYVIKDGLGYLQDNSVFKVEHYSPRQTFRSDGLYEVPPPRFEIYRNGFEVSIPYEEGITGFAFIGTLSRHTESSISQEWHRYVERPLNGRMVIREPNTQLELGDGIAYIIAVRTNYAFYYLDDVFEVKHYD